MLRPELKEAGDAIITAVRTHVTRAVAPLIARRHQHARAAESTADLIADHEARIEALERREQQQ